MVIVPLNAALPRLHSLPSVLSAFSVLLFRLFFATPSKALFSRLTTASYITEHLELAVSLVHNLPGPCCPGSGLAVNLQVHVQPDSWPRQPVRRSFHLKFLAHFFPYLVLKPVTPDII